VQCYAMIYKEKVLQNIIFVTFANFPLTAKKLRRPKATYRHRLSCICENVNSSSEFTTILQAVACNVLLVVIRSIFFVPDCTWSQCAGDCCVVCSSSPLAKLQFPDFLIESLLPLAQDRRASAAFPGGIRRWTLSLFFIINVILEIFQIMCNVQCRIANIF
jgi:hypothetical protein